MGSSVDEQSLLKGEDGRPLAEPGICSMGGEWQETFEANLGEFACYKWMIRLFNVVMAVCGGALIAMAVAALNSDLPLGSTLTYTIILGVVLIALGVVGFVTTNAKCSFLAMAYFLVVMVLTVGMFWCMLYTLLNMGSIEQRVKLSLTKTWPQVVKVLPAEVQGRFTAKKLSCGQMTEECWGEVRAFMSSKALYVCGIIVGLVFTLVILLLSITKMLSLKNVVATTLGVMDAGILLFGISLTTCGAYLFSSQAHGAHVLAIIIMSVGVAFILLATFFGHFCDAFYEKCCNSCNYAWTVATFAYGLLALCVLAIAIIGLTKEDDMAEWVEHNFDKICDQACVQVMGKHIGHAFSNPNCTATANGTVACEKIPPRECYTKAIQACDTATASHSAIAMELVHNVEDLSWAMFLLFEFLLIQVGCKFYKWKYEDDEGFEMSNEGFDTAPYGT